jgi:hypothetical protein
VLIRSYCRNLQCPRLPPDERSKSTTWHGYANIQKCIYGQFEMKHILQNNRGRARIIYAKLANGVSIQQTKYEIKIFAFASHFISIKNY